MDLPPQPPGSLMGLALLGWMKREHAIAFLLHDCVFQPPLTEHAAESLWREYRHRAEEIPERAAAAPPEVPLDKEEEEYASRFLEFLRQLGDNRVRVIKIDPMQLVAVQFHIAVNRAGDYIGSSKSNADWLPSALPTSTSNPPLEITFTRRNLDTDINIDLPHSEFLFGVNVDPLEPDGARGHRGFGPKETLAHVTTMRMADRMLLGKGYHRVYARMLATEAQLPGRLSAVALDPSIINPPTRAADADPAGLEIFGRRPPLIADFFSEAHAMPLYLRKKRYRLEVRSRLVALDAD
jgi:hypothetical protein